MTMTSKKVKYQSEQKRLQRAAARQPAGEVPKKELHGPDNPCSLPHCVVCQPEYYRDWYRRTFGKDDPLHKKDHPELYGR